MTKQKFVITLDGPGPAYTANDIHLKDVKVGGSIEVQDNIINIQLTMPDGGKFPGNGAYRLRTNP